MALAVNSEMPSNVGFGESNGSGTLASPQTFDFTNTAGTLLVLTVVIGVGSGQTSSIDSVTYGGVAMTKLLEQSSSGGANGGRAYLWYLLNPATGSNTVSMTFSENTSGDLSITAGCVSFTGHHTTTPFAQSTVANGSSASASATLTGCVSGNMTIAGCGGGSTFSSSTQTLSWAANESTGNSLGCGRSSRAASSGSVTHQFTLGSDSWVVVLAEIAVASSAQTIAVAQASETDSAQTHTRVKLKALTQPSETNTSQAMTRLKTLAAAQASETDTAQVLVRYSNVPRLRVVRSNLINT